MANALWVTGKEKIPCETERSHFEIKEGIKLIFKHFYISNLWYLLILRGEGCFEVYTENPNR